MEAAINYQNDRVHTTSPGNIAECARRHYKGQKSIGIMVWAVVASDVLKSPFTPSSVNNIAGALKVNNRVYEQI